MATAVISGYEAMSYVHGLWSGLPVVPATVGLLALFMVLTIVGIAESSRVAVAIFLFHLSALALLLMTGIVTLPWHGLSTLLDNLQTPAGGRCPAGPVLRLLRRHAGDLRLRVLGQPCRPCWPTWATSPAAAGWAA